MGRTGEEFGGVGVDVLGEEEDREAGGLVLDYDFRGFVEFLACGFCLLF